MVECLKIVPKMKKRVMAFFLNTLYIGKFVFQRAGVAKGLGEMAIVFPDTPRETLKHLLIGLEDKDSFVKSSVSKATAQAIKVCPDAAEDVLDQLLTQLYVTDRKTQERSVNMLSIIFKQSPHLYQRIIPGLLKALNADDETIRYQAAMLLGDMIESDTEYGREITLFIHGELQKIQCDENLVMKLVVHTATRAPEYAAGFIPIFLAHVQSHDTEIRAEAIRSLPKIAKTVDHKKMALGALFTFFQQLSAQYIPRYISPDQMKLLDQRYQVLTALSELATDAEIENSLHTLFTGSAK